MFDHFAAALYDYSMTIIEKSVGEKLFTRA